MIIAFIPVRGGSKSIPLKNIKLFCGKPLVYWSIKALSECKEIDRIVVATDSEKIKETVESFSIDKLEVYDRNPENAVDTATTESVMLEFIKADNTAESDIFMLVQATSPLTQSIHFSDALRMYKNSGYDSVLSCVRNYRFFINRRTCSSKVHFDYVLSCGNKVLSALPQTVVYNKVIPCHSVPYNEFLNQSKETFSSISKPYFVFIDQALTIHPDNKGLQAFTEKYREELHRALSYISKKNGDIKIIIAEHPRIQYPASFWGNYEHISGKTASLIAGASSVIGHFSTSLTLAFLAKKNIMLLDSTSAYFPFKDSIHLMFTAVGGMVLDMQNLIVTNEKPSNSINLKDIFSLCPDDNRLNSEIFLDFFPHSLDKPFANS